MIDKLKFIQKLREEGKLHSKTRLYLSMIFTVFFLSGCIIIYDILFLGLHWFLPILVAIPSFFVGNWFARMHKVDITDDEKILMIFRTDRNGIILIILFIIFRLASREIFANNFFSVATVGTLILASISGVAFGRLHGVIRGIKKTYKKHKKTL